MLKHLLLGGLAITTLAAAALVARSPAAFAKDRPGTPNNVQARTLSDASIQLTWSNTASECVTIEAAVTINGQNWDPSPNPIGFALGNGPGGIGSPFCGTYSGLQEDTFTYTNLQPDSLYCFALRARNSSDTVSDLFSAWACTWTYQTPAPAPAAPASTAKPTGKKLSTSTARTASLAVALQAAAPTSVLAQELLPGLVDISWLNPDGLADHFQIERNGVVIAGNVAAGSYDYTDSASESDPNPSAGQTYGYRVCAVSADGARACSALAAVNVQ